MCTSFLVTFKAGRNRQSEGRNIERATVSPTKRHLRCDGLTERFSEAYALATRRMEVVLSASIFESVFICLEAPSLKIIPQAEVVDSLRIVSGLYILVSAENIRD